MKAAADGSNTATDLTPNMSFLIDITPEEAFESIQARGNEAEISTINLDFLKYLDEAYRTFWSEDMAAKGCSVVHQEKVSHTFRIEKKVINLHRNNLLPDM